MPLLLQANTDRVTWWEDGKKAEGGELQGEKKYLSMFGTGTDLPEVFAEQEGGI